jgi:putative nucleotidyltransferase with HDIG domain
MSVPNGKRPKRKAARAAASLHGVEERAGRLAASLRELVRGPLDVDAEHQKTNGAPRLIDEGRFSEQLSHEIERARRARRQVSVMLAELAPSSSNDSFPGSPLGQAANGSHRARPVANGSYLHFVSAVSNGNAGGPSPDVHPSRDGVAEEELCSRIGAVLTGQKRQIDFAARIDGGTFALILPETSEAGALTAARRLRLAIAASFQEMAEQAPVRLGIASFPRHAKNAEGLLIAAHHALVTTHELSSESSFPEGTELPVAVASHRGAAQSQRRIGALLSLAETVDVRSRGAVGHSQSVGRHAQAIARELGLDEEVVERIRLAGLLHDIGMVGVDEHVLRKPGPLSPEEWEAVQSHPDTGARLLSETGLDDVREWVLRHHERIDGTGYPGSLAASAIPLGARIVGVADAFEAMTADRPHRGAMPVGAAEQELLDCSNAQFDRRVVKAFLRVLARRAHPAPSRASA